MTTAGQETLDVHKWLYSTMAGDSALVAAAPGGFHSGIAPPRPTYPFVRFGIQAPMRVIRGVGVVEFMMTSLWLIRGVDNNASYVNLTAVSKRIQALFAGVINVALPDGMILSCVREEAFQLEQVEGGREYRHLGGMYRIEFQ